MKNILKAAIVALGTAGALAAVPAVAQPYDDGYYNGSDEDGYAGDDEDYGYCDPYYGCPDDYYDQPVYYGQVYWGDEWFDGPIYYRDWGGRRQFWIHGGWRYTNQYRGGRFGPALGRGWYGQHRNEVRGLYNHGGYNRGGNRNYGNYRDYSQRYGGSSHFQSQAAPQTYNRGNDNWRSGWNNRQGFGQNGYSQRQQSAPQSSGGERVTRGNFWQGRQNAAPQQSSGARGEGGGRHGDGGGRGDGSGRDGGHR